MLATKNLDGPGRAAVWLRGVPLLVLLGLMSCTPPGPKALLEGERLVRARDFTQAIERCLVATELLPSNAHAWNYLGLAYHGAGKPAEARQAYTQALSRDRNLAIVRFNLGCLLLETGDYPASVNEFTTFTIVQQQSEQGFVKLASAQIKTRAYDAAEASLKKALQLNPRNPESLNNLGWILLQKRRGREAYNQFLAAIQSDPKYAPALLNLAIVSQQMNNRPLALKAYRDYLQCRKEPFLPGPELIEPWIAQLASELQPVAKPPATIPTNAPPAEAAARTPPPAPLLSSTGTHPPNTKGGQPSPLPPALDFPAVPAQPKSATVGEPKANPDNLGKNAIPSPAVGATTPIASPPASVSEAQKTKAPEPVDARPKPDAETLLTSKKPEPTVVVSPVGNNAPPPPPVAAEPQPKEIEKRPSTPVVDTPLVRAASPPEGGVFRSSTPTAPPETEETARDAAAAAEKTGFWQRVNPWRWIRGSDKPSTVTPLRASDSQDVNGAANKPGGPQPSSTDRKATPPAPGLPLMKRIDSTEKIVEVASASIPRSGPRYASRITVPLTAGDLERSRNELNTGLQLREQGKLEGALEAYRRAVAADPRHYEARYALGLGLAEVNDLPGSLAAYEAAVSVKPDAIPARYNFALALRKSGFPEDAADQATAILARSPNEVRAHLLLGSLWSSELGVVPKAREHYRAVLEIEPRHPQSAVIRTWLATHP